jgi:glycosyltransferase involved in cell wall biosynthesis
MQQTVLSVAYPLTEVGEDAVGGSEQVLTILDRALTERGHRSLVIAAEGSKIRGTLISSPAVRGKLDDSVRQWAQKVHKKLIEGVLSRYSVDIVHMHSLDFHRYLPDAGTPTLATLHLPPDWYPSRIFRMKREQLYMNCVSASQQKTCPKSPLLLPVIPNGIDVAKFARSETRKNFVLALGRICPEKGFHLAIQAAKKAKVELVLAGEVYPYTAHREYFKKCITPALDRRRRFVGPVGFEQKRALLAQAKCLLITSTVAETSSLVAMEALASGTPVIAYRSGALPEIVEDGRTGFLVSSVGEMTEAIKDVGQLKTEDCREAARRRYSSTRMIDRYLQTYRSIIAKNDGKYDDARDRTSLRPSSSWPVSW